MIWKTFLNPFAKFSELTLLVAGLMIFAAGVLIASYCGVIFDGVFDVHVAALDTKQNFLILLVDVACIFVLLLALGKFINKKTRVIDILNTSLVSRLPIHILGLFTNNVAMDTINEKILKSIEQPEHLDFSFSEMAILIGFSILSMLFLAYFIILLVNGFRTATNAKKWQHFVLFAMFLIIAEIISKSIISFI